MNTRFQPHEINWTAETSANFWNHFAEATAATPDHYFSHQLGEYLIEYVEKQASIKGRVLDYGCGPGFLMRHLLQRGIACEGLDFSPASIEKVRDQLADHPLFRGAEAASSVPTPLPGAHFDTLFCVEVIEHLLEEHLEPTLGEIHRLLRPGGLLVVTTPNEEDLAASKVLCPECGCLFHRYQHIRNWSAQTLRQALEAVGFETLSCQATTFGPKPKLAGVRHLLRKLRGQAEPPGITLVYIGRRAGA